MEKKEQPLDAKTRTVLVLGVLGVVGSYLKFIEWMRLNGLNIFDGWMEAFTSSNLFGLGFTIDLVACTFIVLALAFYERRRLKLRWVVSVFAGTIVFGVCLGLAIYIVGRERTEA